LRQHLGRDLVIEARWARNDPEHLSTLAQELAGLRLDVIVTGNTAATVAARRATSEIPLVCAACTDPVGMGLATSEARPGSNVTGILTRVEGLTGKQLELASEVLPRMTMVGVLINIGNPSNLVQRREIERAAARLRVIVVPTEVRVPGDLHRAFQGLANSGANLVLVLQDSMFLAERKRIALIAAATRRPTMFSFRENVEDGGLMSYGIDVRENFRRAAVYVGRILRGEKPSDLPFEFATKLALVINLQTAALLGLTIPPILLARADEVIE
jgi:putative tryptophan/tyrosine transport system substrate-binding protein